MINFYKLRIPAFTFSLILIFFSIWQILGIKSINLGPLTSKGFNLGIDFQGGLVHQITVYSGISQDEIRDFSIKTGLGSEVQQVLIADKNVIGKETSYLIKTLISKEEQEMINKDPDLTPTKFLSKKINDFHTMIKEKYGDTYTLKGEELIKANSINNETINGEIVEERTNDQRILQNVVKESENTVSPVYSEGLRTQAVLLTIFVLAAMLIYITFRFKIQYAVAAIAALIHDSTIMLGFVAVSGLEVDYSILAAVLFIIGYSINDTIVIFDRIRENNGIMKESSHIEVMNVSINQTLSRTIITSLTTLLAIFALLLWGGPKIRGFSITTAIGLFFGSYSTIFIASPIMLFWEKRFMGKKNRIIEIKKEEKIIEKEKHQEQETETNSEENADNIIQNKPVELNLSKKLLKKLSGKKKRR